MRTLRIHSLNNFHVYYPSVLITFIMVYITSLVLIYIPGTYLSYNCKFVPFDCLLPISLSSTLPTNHTSDFFSMSLREQRM